MRQREAHDRVARLQQRVVDGRVRLRARVRLHVGVLGAEQRLGAVDRELLDHVDVLAAAVVALARVALGVLVRQHAALGTRGSPPARSSPTRSSRASAAGARARGRSPRRPRDRRRRAGARSSRLEVGHGLGCVAGGEDRSNRAGRHGADPQHASRRRRARSRAGRSRSTACPAARRRRARGRRPRGCPPARRRAGARRAPPAALAELCRTGTVTADSAGSAGHAEPERLRIRAAGEREAAARVGEQQRHAAREERFERGRASARRARAAPPARGRGRRTSPRRACPAGGP